MSNVEPGVISYLSYLVNLKLYINLLIIQIDLENMQISLGE